jgi:hypothetical protein
MRNSSKISGLAEEKNGYIKSMKIKKSPQHLRTINLRFI